MLLSHTRWLKRWRLHWRTVIILLSNSIKVCFMYVAHPVSSAYRALATLTVYLNAWTPTYSSHPSKG